MDMNKTARYQILIKDGRKIIERHYFSDYDDAMAMLDLLYCRYGRTCTIDYKDTDPFDRRQQ